MELEGAFYATVVRPKWYQFGKADKAKQQAEALFQRYLDQLNAELCKSPDGAHARLFHAPHGSLSPRQSEQSKVQKYLLGADECAVTVLPGASAISGHLIALAPYVHRDSEFLVCFFGYLSNLAELQAQYAPGGDKEVGAATTQTVLALYKKFMDLKAQQREELMLSELLGHFSFFIYDGQRKQALAARDPSGEQELYWSLDPSDGSAAFTNSLEQLPPGEPLGRWREVPPGHYVAGGRTPVLRQFALTPEQLETRERHESSNLGFLTDDEDSADEHPKTVAAGISLLTRLSHKHSR